MFAGDSESEFSFNPHDEVSPTQLEGYDSKLARTQKDLLTYQIITPDELEFGWSTNLSGIRGLTEQQTRRILSFENSLQQHLQFDPVGDPGALQTNATFSKQDRKLKPVQTGSVPRNVCRPPGTSLSDRRHIHSHGKPGEPKVVNPSRVFRAVDTPNPLTSGVLSTRSWHGEYLRIASARLNHSLRIGRSKSSFLSLMSFRRSECQENNFTIVSDGLSYLHDRKHSNHSSHPSVEQNRTMCMTSINTDTGLRGLKKKISRALLGRNAGSSLTKLDLDSFSQEDSPILYNLSHDMVGAASPFPMRAPLK